jgi:epoxyqueuosine reductase
MASTRVRSVSWRLVPFKHVEEMEKEIDSRLKEGLLDPVLHRVYFISTFKMPEGMPQPKSVAVVAAPQPALRLTFRKGDKPIKVAVPPTYFDAAEVDSLAVRELKKAYGEKRNFVRAYLPLKLLACRAGLAFYGRNNIAYVPGRGSFCRLTAFYTDVEPGDYIWQEPKVLPDCEGCRLCIDACPAKVMGGGRFMAKAERCLTYLNEKPPEVPFPDWVMPPWHNALIGCMICQRVCPANREVIGWVEDRGEFSEDETDYLLKGDFSDKAKAGKVEEKLKRAGLDLSGFPRNLKALIRG